MVITKRVRNIIYILSTMTSAKCANRCSAQAVWKSLPKTVINSDSVTVLSKRHSSSPRLSLLLFLSNTLPGPRASEVTTLWRYTNTIIIVDGSFVKHLSVESYTVIMLLTFTLIMISIPSPPHSSIPGLKTFLFC